MLAANHHPRQQPPSGDEFGVCCTRQPLHFPPSEGMFRVCCHTNHVTSLRQQVSSVSVAHTNDKIPIFCFLVFLLYSSPQKKEKKRRSRIFTSFQKNQGVGCRIRAIISGIAQKIPFKQKNFFLSLFLWYKGIKKSFQAKIRLRIIHRLSFFFQAFAQRLIRGRLRFIEIFRSDEKDADDTWPMYTVGVYMA